ncbi:Mo-dependent nitrogenase-like protein [Trichormus variabilis ATCC 29413]|uniref:Mo-dependent nitrogenase-like protein n=2 Tax=Anabaena variabilis TaxID=264691 RepID=Q3MAF2_TRIV2|nr:MULTISPECIES: Mo-dependent nitrogenase C-terminal domain-containing protein [Nostocaceae]ABA22034.1 Mo-dependent nitrogenase-like protein [Trichormus variabilis ATCC 29413]MBC1213704.1 Mo-dependent nitrogenase C-terminal domain-containing protein [Trichormus variabilis ARAD]MBC1258686.1 Mo-dependent nitrogenase C-terminal domain-containing protein [Trichormus variabilis V5]MBC1270434.1 Mo-dependent nitrogenase C-terminal domain-containing protein [Trichormus variabilis FSR]MBC1303251.1 Mo-d
MMSSITFSFVFVVNLLLQPIRQWLESLKIENHRLARWLCTIIPASCPFERELKWGDRTLVHIPPLCKLNPFYKQLIEIRFKALMYLADECGEDVTQFC